MRSESGLARRRRFRDSKGSFALVDAADGNHRDWLEYARAECLRRLIVEPYSCLYRVGSDAEKRL